jgi:hypothetical protein
MQTKRPLKYIVQTRNAFSTKYKEHLLAIRNNSGNSGCSAYLHNTDHTYGTVKDAMDIIKTGTKWQYLNILEKNRIHLISERYMHMKPNPSGRTGPGVDSASNRNGYQESLKIKKPGGKVRLARRADNLAVIY